MPGCTASPELFCLGMVTYIPMLQGPKFIWVDNSDIVGALLRKIFPKAIIMEDSTHMMRRVTQTLTSGHPLNRDFC